jgi:hypothetical protein
MLKTLLLILILLLAFFMAFIPHIGYAYPLHLDEWLHLAHTNALIEAGSITYPDPFYGKEITGLLSSQEVNYHLLLASLSEVSGIDWLVLFRFGPSLVLMLTVLAVYVLCRKEGYGLEAAFFTCLIPTTVGLMGPAFLVPVALGLTFIPLSLFIAFKVKSWPSYLLLTIIACFLWLLHPPTATVLYIIIAPYILLNLKSTWRNSISLATALLIPLLIALPWMWSMLLPALVRLQAAQPLPAQVDIPALLWLFGVFPLILCFMGIIVMARRGGRQSYGLIFGLGLLLFTGLALLWLQYGMYIIYLRGLHTALLLMGIMAGAGLLWVSSIKAPAGSLLSALAVVAVLVMAVPARLEIPYYHMIDDDDYRAFVWIGANSAANEDPVMLDPWQASAFTALSGRNVYKQITGGPAMEDNMVWRFLNDGCAGSAFLRENKVTLLYNRLPCCTTDLDKIRDNVYYTAHSGTGDNLTAANLLVNGSFDALTPLPLHVWIRASSNIKPDLLFPEPGRVGGSCIGLRTSAASPYKPWPVARWQQQVAVQPGTTYIIGGWIKTQDITGEGGARLAGRWLGSGNKNVKFVDLMPYVKDSGGWSYYECRADAPEGATTFLLQLELAGCSGTSWFDDITFRAE